MQAGDTLNFIQPFIGGEARPKGEAEPVSAEDTAVLKQLLERFINDQVENVHSFQVLELHGFVTVFEASYKLDMQDGSYLHIVVYGSQTENGLLDFGVSLNEHYNDGIFNGGYVYTYDTEGLSRSTSRADDIYDGDEDDDDQDYRKIHFMVSDLYASRDQLHELKLSDDPESVEHALATERKLQEELQFDEMISASGYDNRPPLPGELEKVMTLIWDARPFPLHITE